MNRVLPWLRGRVDLPLVRDTALLSSGSVVAQLVMLAAMPVWARLYSPEDFGVLRLWTAVV
ncbi:MAG TPA: polysaccharide biosynthesis protein, partial [Burkholderiaceae bacterium]|nr:polysaccharide biosynthesis protein [Burkholderiaceae bacterium]